MDMTRIIAAIDLVESADRQTLQIFGLLVDSKLKKIVEPVKRRKYRKRKSSVHRYTDEQIRRAWELKAQGISSREIAKTLGMDAKTVASGGYMKRRLAKMANRIPKNDRIGIF